MTEDDWKAWNEERQRFRELEPQGFEQDTASLEEHIRRLVEIAPKDKAGWMYGNALDIINLLQKQLNLAKAWMG